MTRLRSLIKNLLYRRRVERDLTAEVDSYLELLTAEKIAAGLTPAAARRAARLELGGAEVVKEEVRDARAGALLDEVSRDLRYAFRGLRRSPGFSGFAVVTFALAIGGITLVTTLVNAVLLKPLPYPDADRLVVVAEVDAQNRVGGYVVAAPNYQDWERRNRVFEGMALYEYVGFNLSGEGQPEQVGGLRVTSRLFEVLRATPLLGRGFVPMDDSGRSGRIVILSHRLWQRRYGGDSAIVGRAIRINKAPSVVVGVMPRGFAFPSGNQALWVPVGLTEEDQSRGSHSFWSVARLRDGISYRQARSEMGTIGDQLAREYPATNTGESANVIPLRDLWIHDVERIFQLLLVAVVLVALIASANIASLLVARGSVRRRELAARMALGGSRARIVAQLATESILLAALGAVGGLAIAMGGLPSLVRMLPDGVRNVPFRDLSAVSIDLLVFGVAAGVALVAGLLSGLVPAVAVLPETPGEVLQNAQSRGATARRGGRLRNVLVAVEVGLALVVVMGAGLLVVSMRKVLGVDPGLDPEKVIGFHVALPQPDFYGVPERPELCANVRQEVEGIPGVAATSAVSHLPLTGANASRSFVIEGRSDPGPGALPSGNYGVTCPEYFRTMGIPMLDGRDFLPTDRAGAPPVVIINESLARRYFPNETPVGRRIRFGRYDTTDEPWVTIIAVVGNVRHSGLGAELRPYLYRPYSQTVWPEMTVVVQGAGNPLAFAAAVRKALARIVPEEPVGDVVSMGQVVDASLGYLRFPMTLFTVFAAIAVTLAAVGIFGVASQSVAQRRRELGIRRAVGATEGQLYRLVIAQTMVPVGLGIAGGIIGGLAAGRMLEGLLYGIGPTSLPTFGGGSLLLVGVALAAAVVPASRAARIDPAAVLRED